MQSKNDILKSNTMPATGLGLTENIENSSTKMIFEEEKKEMHKSVPVEF